jgi:hypothetical protein
LIIFAFAITACEKSEPVVNLKEELEKSQYTSIKNTDYVVTEERRISDIECINPLCYTEPIDEEIEEIPLEKVKSKDEAVEFNIVNNSEYELFFRDEYVLEILLDDEWYAVPMDGQDYKDILAIVPPKYIYDSKEELSTLKFNFVKGRYRVIKEFLPNTDTTDKWLGFVEFQIV